MVAVAMTDAVAAMPSLAGDTAETIAVCEACAEWIKAGGDLGTSPGSERL